jgi:hypothetical protein
MVDELIRQFSIWKERRTGREVLVLSANSSWVEIRGLESGRRSHVATQRFLIVYGRSRRAPYSRWWEEPDSPPKLGLRHRKTE